MNGSYDHALRALRFATAAGLKPGVNTQINALSKPYLREIFDTIVEHGAGYWQVQITVAMGNAVDNDALLLQPHEIPEVLDTLAELFDRGRKIGFRILPGNNIGYFGPHEYMWRTITSEPEHWAGCTAGETSLGLEADGKIKSCPSLPADPYGGGNSRDGLDCRGDGEYDADDDTESTARRPPAFAAPATTGTSAAAAAPG